MRRLLVAVIIAAVLGFGAGPASAKNDGTPNDNRRQNQQFRDAVKRCERTTGRKLSADDRQRLHHAISGQGYTFTGIVDECVAMFPKKPKGGSSGAAAVAKGAVTVVVAGAAVAASVATAAVRR